ncbi:hypothetical protein BDV35DRAFT_375113, partial [Aspergillus flavus]
MEATELPPDAKSPDNCPAGNMASASFREFLWEDKHGMEQLGWIKITASNEDEEAARTIIEMMRSNTEGTRHDTPPTQLEVTNDTHQRTLARSVPPTISWLDEENQKIFKRFMEAGVDLEAIITSCFSKEDPSPIHQPLRPVLFKCDGVKTSLYRVHPNADSISIFRPIGCDVGPENGMFMVYPCSDQLDMEDIQGPPTSIRIKSGELLVIRGRTIVETVNTGGGIVMWKGCSTQPLGVNLLGQHVLPFLRAHSPNFTMVD